MSKDKGQRIKDKKLRDRQWLGKGLLALLSFALCPLSLLSEPPDAVVRLPSHGASGTVIHTANGRSLILSCAHAFEGKARMTPVTLDVPCLRPGPPRKGRV